MKWTQEQIYLISRLVICVVAVASIGILFLLVHAAGAAMREAAEISNHAAGVVVGKLGAAAVTREELLATFTISGPRA